jgi:hypothetical protein
VGTTRLFIPAPEGYLLITSNMQPFAGVAERFVPPVNEEFALFLPEAGAIAAARGATDCWRIECSQEPEGKVILHARRDSVVPAGLVK